MDIGKAVKQKKFKNPHQKMEINIMYTHAWLEEEYTKVLKDKKLSTTQYNVLRILKGSHPSPCTAQDIQERMINKRSDVTRLVERLRKLELVTRDVCEANRRKVDIMITNNGMKLLSELDPAEEELGKNLKKLTADEANQLSDLLDKLRG